MAQFAELPNWVNESQFVEMFKPKYPTFQKITKFIASKVLRDGENYITSIIRISIELELNDGNTQSEHFILKIPFSTDRNNTNAGEYHELFRTETDMYSNVIPELERIFSAYGRQVQFKPRHFQLPAVYDCDYMLLADLQSQGYRHESQLGGFDEEHTMAALSKLAKWHAATAKRVELKGDYALEYKQSYFTLAERDMIEQMNAAFERPFLECLEFYELTDRENLTIRRFMRNLNDLYIKYGTVNTSAFNVLNHGDFWLSNIMFQHANEQAGISETLFLDFQLPKYGSPAQDLLTFLMTTPALCIRLNEFDALVRHYHKKLLKNLRLLKYAQTLPTLDMLHAQLAKHGFWAFVAVQRLLAVALLDPHENSNIETWMNTNQEGIAFKKRMFSNPRYVKQMKVLLPWLVDRKYLDTDICYI